MKPLSHTKRHAAYYLKEFRDFLLRWGEERTVSQKFKHATRKAKLHAGDAKDDLLAQASTLTELVSDLKDMVSPPSETEQARKELKKGLEILEHNLDATLSQPVENIGKPVLSALTKLKTHVHNTLTHLFGFSKTARSTQHEEPKPAVLPSKARQATRREELMEKYGLSQHSARKPGRRP